MVSKDNSLVCLKKYQPHSLQNIFCFFMAQLIFVKLPVTLVF